VAERRTPDPARHPDPEIEPAGDHDGPDFSLVLPLSLLAGGLAAYPSLSAAADGQGDFMAAVILFLGATLLATFGFGVVAVLFHSFSSGGDDEDAPDDGDQTVSTGPGYPAETDGPVPTVALNPPHDARSDAIDTALAPTDALVHDAT
jgi:hypothetical protein